MSAPALLPGPRRGWRGVTLTVVATLAIVLTTAIAVRSSNGSDPAPPDRGGIGIDRGADDELVPGPDMHDAGNIEQLVASLQTVYGTTEAVQATLYADHAMLLIPVPDDPGMQRRLTYNGVFHRAVDDERRTAQNAMIDLQTVDWDAVVDLIGRGSKTLGAGDPDDLFAVITEQRGEHRVLVSSRNDSVSSFIQPIE